MLLAYGVVNMDSISIRLPSEFVDIIDEMVLDGKLASRSEGIRLALREFHKINYSNRDKQTTDFNYPEQLLKNKNIYFED